MLKSRQKNARTTFESWAICESFPLTAVFRAWTELVKHGTNKSKHDSADYLGIYVCDFALAVLCDPNVKIVREETKLWAEWYGKH